MSKNSKNSVNGIHAKRSKAIRSFVNFDYDLRKPLTEYQKRKVRDYYDEIDALTNRANQIYRPRKKENLFAAQRLAQHEKMLPGLKVAFIPTAEPVKVTLTKTGGSYKTKHIKTKVITINPKSLASNPDREIRRVLKVAKGASNFHILAGRYEIRKPVRPNKLEARIKTLMGRYSEGGKLFRKSRKGNSNHYRNWLIGVAANTFTEQAAYNEYLDAKKEAAEKVKAEKRKAKRRKNNAKVAKRRQRNRSV